MLIDDRLKNQQEVHGNKNGNMKQLFFNSLYILRTVHTPYLNCPKKKSKIIKRRTINY